jgi:predicted Zn-dependent protease
MTTRSPRSWAMRWRISARNHAAQRARNRPLQASGSPLVNVGLGAADVENRERWAGILGAGVTFGVLLPYSREHELEADRLGVDYMARAGYDPRQALAFWAPRPRRTRRSDVELMSTHPSDATRIENLERHIAEQGYA